MNPGILTPPSQFATMPRGLLGRPTPVPMVDARRVFDPDAERYIAAVERADGRPLEEAVGVAIGEFVIGCKEDGIWSAIRASCILMGARTLAGALVPLVGSAPTNNNFVSGDYNRRTGLVGNGTTKFLNSNRNNNADGQDDQHLAVYVSVANATGGNSAYIGAGFGENGSSQIVWSTGGGTFYRSRSGGTTASVFGGAAQIGLHGISRSTGGSFAYAAGALSGTLSLTSQTPFSQNVAVFGRNLTAQSNGRMAFYSVGSSIALSSLNSRLTTLYNAIGAAIP